ncbi:hypothetical protein [Candidatus Amarolinea dominans]|uniref:hypothetical protein n=1 Tax=Candidatus Amarolinea dominans TaxID=3140696 RepID=UPI0031CCAD3B
METRPWRHGHPRATNHCGAHRNGGGSGAHTARPVTPLTESAQPTPGHSGLALDVPVIEVGWRIVTAADGQRTTEWEIADNAAGHHINSAAPGTAGNVVVSGATTSAGVRSDQPGC